MSELAARRDESGALVVLGITPLLAAVLRELPGLLGAEPTDAVRRRLLPDPMDDEEFVAEWRVHQHPELLALLSDARSIVMADLHGLRRKKGSRKSADSHITIPAAHVNAWISALNAARLVLAAQNELTADDMAMELHPPTDERDLALIRVHLYSWLQGTLIEAVLP